MILSNGRVSEVLLAIGRVAFVFGASSRLTQGSTFKVVAWVSWVSRTPHEGEQLDEPELKTWLK